eukprot:TRINITY_DN11316_c1_g1_i1.p1 TRINITY_DN11316_c1_g1~~TRINITY_DN11316_c1_g1_i1.p1  ORF type:complete len:342 (-),score=58.96 TRINITY_DN11316_c1_g1_i1:73-1098(-)
MSAAAAKSPVLLLDHVNLNVEDWTPDLEAFWMRALGCISDPRADAVSQRARAAGGQMKGLKWVNIGLQQFHMPLGEPEDATQRAANLVVGLILPGPWEEVRQRLSDHKVVFSEVDVQGRAATGLQLFGSALQAESPTGVQLRLHEGSGQLLPPGAAEAGVAQPGGVSWGLGMAYVEFVCEPGTAAGIGRFYQQMLGVPVENLEGACRVLIQTGQFLLFCETDRPVPAYDNHHIAIYVGCIATRDISDSFTSMYGRCKQAGLVWNNPRFPHLTYDSLEAALGHGEFRVVDIVDPETELRVYRLEHEIRSLRHPGFPCKSMLSEEATAGTCTEEGKLKMSKGT